MFSINFCFMIKKGEWIQSKLGLGFLINELNRDDFLPYEQPPRRLELPLFLTFTVILSVIGISALGYIIYKKVRSYRANVDGLPFNRKRNTEDDL